MGAATTGECSVGARNREVPPLRAQATLRVNRPRRPIPYRSKKHEQVAKANFAAPSTGRKVSCGRGGDCTTRQRARPPLRLLQVFAELISKKREALQAVLLETLAVQNPRAKATEVAVGIFAARKLVDKASLVGPLTPHPRPICAPSPLVAHPRPLNAGVKRGTLGHLCPE